MTGIFNCPFPTLTDIFFVIIFFGKNIWFRKSHCNTNYKCIIAHSFLLIDRDKQNAYGHFYNKMPLMNTVRLPMSI